MFLWQVCLVLMGCVIAQTSARRMDAEHGEVLEKINSARCTSRCLTLHVTQLTASFKHLQSDDVLVWCENHRRCAQCLQPCKELWETRKALSQKSCEKHHECLTSWDFLVSVRTAKQGDCPPPQRATGFAAACVESCSSDRHCSSSKKCCSNGCGHTCQTPANLFKGVPLKPRREMTFLEDRQGHLEVTWMSKFNVTIEPVLYVLQRRWNMGILPSEDHASTWHTVAMTMEERAVLKDVRPQRWYQFRVSAVNSQGTRGFTTPSKPFYSTRDPFPPEPPQRVRVGNETLGEDGRVGLLLLWDTPREGDLPLHHYKVTWTPRHAPRHAAGHDRKDNARVTDGTVCEMELPGLLSGSAYLLQVQAVTYWGQKRLKSSRAQLPFTTATNTASSLLPPSPPAQESLQGEFSNELPSAPNPAPHPDPDPALANLRLEVAAPHYHDNQLQVKVFWKRRHHQESPKDTGTYVLRWYPHACAGNATKAERRTTVQGTHYIITGLLFGCKYSVSVAPVATEEDLRSEAVAWVTTPVCSSVKGRGGKTMPCVGEERPLVSKKVVLRPEKLTAEFHTVNGSLVGQFSWQLAQNAPGQTPIAGFQFTWAQLSVGAGVAMATEGQDFLISQTQIVAPDQRSLMVVGLHPESVYQLQVQVLSEGASGASVSRTLHTPSLNASLL
ncbi:anosmin-1b isoform X1 [Hypomesus transpacificus]|uniref:anosmin-1b isoform X1 n=1 Tax=Hypomesus transpacificus TaxID=137520 RepID=UPI001F07B929|nr:anosmin-1b isoform X1 [Hypomesus transpacificus]